MHRSPHVGGSSSPTLRCLSDKTHQTTHILGLPSLEQLGFFELLGSVASLLNRFNNATNLGQPCSSRNELLFPINVCLANPHLGVFRAPILLGGKTFPILSVCHSVLFRTSLLTVSTFVNTLPSIPATQQV